MPPGAFATRTPAEDRILATQPLRLDIPAYTERPADAGAAAVPLLARILTEDAAVEQWWRRQCSLACCRRAC